VTIEHGEIEKLNEIKTMLKDDMDIFLCNNKCPWSLKSKRNYGVGKVF